MIKGAMLSPALVVMSALPALAEAADKVINIVPTPAAGAPGTNWLVIAVLAAVAIVFFGVMIGGVIGKSSN